jgi:hypothetical protein
LDPPPQQPLREETFLPGRKKQTQQPTPSLFLIVVVRTKNMKMESAILPNLRASSTASLKLILNLESKMKP